MCSDQRKGFMIMYTRVQKSNGQDYLQIVEDYREGDRVRQQSILYVGPYESIDHALDMIPRVSRYWRHRATQRSLPEDIEWSRAEAAADADSLDERLGKLRRLVEEHPDLVEQDRARVEGKRT
jgi:hypothetical protein